MILKVPISYRIKRKEMLGSSRRPIRKLVWRQVEVIIINTYGDYIGVQLRRPTRPLSDIRNVVAESIKNSFEGQS